MTDKYTLKFILGSASNITSNTSEYYLTRILAHLAVLFQNEISNLSNLHAY